MLSARLDKIVTRLPGVKSRSEAQRLIEAGFVKVNGSIVTKSSSTYPNDANVELEVSATGRDNGMIEPVEFQLDILHEDDACIVVNKPRGIAVHPAPMGGKNPTVLHGAAFLFQKRKLPFSAAETLVHRLDKDTTGCLLLAKTPSAHLALQQQFADRTVEKHYLALVLGIPKANEAMIDAPIGRHHTQRTKMSVLHAGAGREAKTSYRLIGTSQGVSLLDCTLHTGRTHQIRVHLSAIGHPLLGDTAYTSHAARKKAHEIGVTSLCLHAWKLSFKSPATKKIVAVTCPLPKDFQAILAKFNIGDV